MSADDDDDAAHPSSSGPPYPRAEPPAVLYHAVSADRLARVLAEGLTPTGKPHVHLARRPQHARNAIRAQHRPILLAVDAARACAEGGTFYVSPKGTWLTPAVPPQFLQVVTDP